MSIRKIDVYFLGWMNSLALLSALDGEWSVFAFEVALWVGFLMVSLVRGRPPIERGREA